MPPTNMTATAQAIFDEDFGDRPMAPAHEGRHDHMLSKTQHRPGNFPKYPGRREIAIAGSGTPAPAERLRLIGGPVLEAFNSDSSFGARGGVQSLATDPLKTSEPPGGTTGEISFGPFRLLPAQFLLLDGDKPVPLKSRAMHILIVLLERPGKVVTRQELMARVWPNLFVVPPNLTVHISALRHALRDGRDGNRFIINIRGRGYCFVGPIG